MDLDKCDVCDMVFHDIGRLPGRKRIIHHKRIEHRAECGNCGKCFVSTSHVAVHKYQAHDILCSRCNKACEGNCLEPVAYEIEQAGEEVMKTELKKLEDQIKDSEQVILHHFSDATKKQMATLQEIAWFLDIGQAGCNSTNWGMLAYLPSVELNMFGISDFSKKYIHKHVHLSALRKLELYLNRLNKEGVLEQINQYTQFCMNFYSENALFDMTPEQLIGGRFCLPEREVRDWSSIQWKEPLQQKKTKGTEAGIVDEIEVETRPEREVRDWSSIQWEEPLQQKKTKGAEAGIID